MRTYYRIEKVKPNQARLFCELISVCGVDDADLITARDRLAQLARSTVTPAPEVEVAACEVDGKTLLVLAVAGGTDPPCGITLPGRKDKPVEFYVRRDATTFPARPEEIRTAVLAAAPPPVAATPWGIERKASEQEPRGKVLSA